MDIYLNSTNIINIRFEELHSSKMSQKEKHYKIGKISGVPGWHSQLSI